MSAHVRKYNKVLRVWQKAAEKQTLLLMDSANDLLI